MPAITDLQDRTIAEALRLYRTGARAVLLEAPTGAGKTRMAARIADALQQGTGVLLLTHRDALTRQNQAAWSSWIPGLQSALAVDGSLPSDVPVIFATIQTAAARLDALPAVGLAVIDEAHHAAEPQPSTTRPGLYARVLDQLLALNPNTRVLAATATPARADGRALHPILEGAPRVAIRLSELEQTGHILLPRTRMLPIHSDRGDGDYRHPVLRHINRQDAGLASGTASTLRRLRPNSFHHQAATGWIAEAADLQTIAYEDRIEDARRFAQTLAGLGVPAGVVDSGQAPEDNRRTLQAYQEGRLRVLVSVGMIDEGLDVPNTRCALILKATTSAIQYTQIVGRTMRRGNNSARPRVLDAGLSTLLHGAIEDRAAIQDYLHEAKTGRLRDTRLRDGVYLPSRHQPGGYSPWKLISRQPPIVAMTTGTHTRLARPLRNRQQETVFLVAETGQGPKTASLRLLPNPETGRLEPWPARLLEAAEVTFSLDHPHHLTRLATATGQTQALETEQLDRDRQQHLASFLQMTDLLRRHQARAERS